MRRMAVCRAAQLRLGWRCEVSRQIGTDGRSLWVDGRRKKRDVKHPCDSCVHEHDAPHTYGGARAQALQNRAIDVDPAMGRERFRL